MKARPIFFGWIGAWLGIGLIYLAYPYTAILETIIGIFGMIAVMLLSLDVLKENAKLKGPTEQ